MIEVVELTSFKCFNDVRFRIGVLTILTGLNSAGKSSLLHSLALFCQTITQLETSQAILLNGPTLSLGTLSDVLCKAGTERKHDFSIGLRTERWEAVWIAGGVDSSELRHAPLLSFKLRSRGEAEFFTTGLQNSKGNAALTFHLVPEDLPSEYNELTNEIRTTLEGISYLSAERIGPREVYPVRLLGERRDVGPQGEFAPWCLEYYNEEPVSAGLAIPDEPALLGKQTSAWLDHFFSGAAVQTRRIPGTNLVKLEFRSTKAGGFHRPQNVGFAMSQVLPIIVGCLSARPGEIILIENPETHLHPGGQSEMGYFLGLVAASGVQLMLETHSDHVLNGIRKFVVEKKFPPQDVAIHFFGDRPPEQGDLQVMVSELKIDRNGRIDHWPTGFFDQLAKDLLSLP